MTPGSFVALAGTVAGVVFGVLLALNLESIVGFFESVFGIKFLAADVYFISDLPSELRFGDVSKIASTLAQPAMTEDDPESDGG